MFWGSSRFRLSPEKQKSIMKKILVILPCLAAMLAYGQNIPEKEIKTDASAVAIFTKGAQVTRKKSVDLQPGTTILKFVDLSPFIDAKSVQVKAAGPVMVLSVNHQQNYLELPERSKELEALQVKLKGIEEKIRMEDMLLSIVNEELAFLQMNRIIGGKNEELDIENLKAAAEFYHEKLTLLKLREIEKSKILEELAKEKTAIQKQISTLTGKKEFPKGEILVKVEAFAAVSARFELSYLVANAGWFPSYDIRVKNVNEPVQLVYKANVRQDTKEEWRNVAVSLSSSDPGTNAIAPKLQTYFLNYHTAPPSYQLSSNQVRGKITGADNEPLPGATVSVKGTTIGTVADVDGNYTLTLPENPGLLIFSLVGYNAEERPVTGPVMNVQLSEDIVTLSELVVTGYGTNADTDAARALPGIAPGIRTAKIKGAVSSIAVPTVQVENQTAVEFEIRTPYTISSENKTYTIDMERYELPAYYEYYSAPKINRDAYLMAYVADWEKYNLLEGEASVFFEDTYVGKSLLDVRFVADTLTLSLGRDKNVVVKREKLRDFTTRQFIGAKKEEVKAWNLSVKNNKSQKINMVVVDQVPVSTLEEIEVETKTISGGEHNTQTGEITWKFTLDPAGMKDFELKYGVKYPKNRSLGIE